MGLKLKTTISMNGKDRIMVCFRSHRRITFLLVLISLPLSLFAQNNPAPAKPHLGMNLAGPADWNTELPFVDVFRMSRPWISQQKGKSWGKGPELALDPYGWVTKLAPDCWVETPLCTIEGGHYPAGKYTIIYEGQGKFDLSNAATIVSENPGRIIIDVNSSRGGFFLKILETDPGNYIRNIRVIMPGFENTYKQNPFHPAFLKRWQGVACFRFMDWMHTNGSKIKSWSDRPTLRHATLSGKGVALEWMIDLCNRQNADAWFCMPHLADDDYIRNFARMVKDKLNPRLKIYIEYSNEVWNSQFQQTRYSWEKAKELNLGNQERPWEGGGQYYSKRSLEIFKIWEKVFGSHDRLVRVLAWQSGNTWWLEQIILPFQDAHKHADALAIAPYISMNVPRQGEKLTADVVSKWSVEKTMDYMEIQSLPRSIDGIRKTKEVADKYGLLLLAYEGGQHMVGIAGGENSDAMTKLFHQCNAHPRMGTIYKKYYDAWGQSGGDLFCYFSSVSRWSKWGSWGILQHYDDNPAQSPKFLATFHWAKSQGQNVNLP
jgi:hypothetical protein